jgi:hypothetical protein
MRSLGPPRRPARPTMRSSPSSVITPIILASAATACTKRIRRSDTVPLSSA